MGPSRIATSSSSWASALHPSNTQETRAKSKKRLQSGGQWKSTFPSLKWSTKVHARGFTFSSKWAEQWPCVYYQAAVWTPSALWSFSPPPQFSSVKALSSPQWHCQARKWGPGKKNSHSKLHALECQTRFCLLPIMEVLQKLHALESNKVACKIRRCSREKHTYLLVSVSFTSSKWATFASVWAAMTPLCDRFSCDSPMHSRISRSLAAASVPSSPEAFA